MGILGILKDFSGWTSCHGIPRIGGAASHVWRIFWVAATLACFGMLGWNTYMLVIKYLAYGSVVGPTNMFQAMPFPAVTVCNLNNFLRSLTQGITAPFGNMMNDYTLAVEHAVSKLPTTSVSPQWNIWNFNDTNDTIVVQAKASEAIAYAVGTFNISYRESLRSAPTLTDLILSCIFDTAACSDSDWKVTKSFIYTTCYTINTAKTFSSVKAGPANGLRMMFRTDQAEYQPWTASVGMKVIIHGVSEDPYPTSFGYTAGTGLVTSYAMKQTNIHKIGPPYSKCSTGTGSKSYDSGTYTIEGCYRACIQDLVIATCACTSAIYPVVSGYVNCDYTNSTQYNCALQVIATVDPTSKCACAEFCDQSVYSVTISTAVWPAGNYIPSQCYKTPFTTAGVPNWQQFQPMWGLPGFNPYQTDCVNWFNNNTGIVEVYFDTMNLRMLTEKESYQMINLVSDFGGQLGLWIGGSLITLFEFFAFIVLMCCFCKNKCCESKPPTKNKVTPTEKPTVKPNEKPNLYNKEENHENLLPPPVSDTH